MDEDTRLLAGMQWLQIPETTSTMDVGWAWLAQGIHGLVIQAEYQISGRGRVQGRTWYGEKGQNVYASFLFDERALRKNSAPWPLLVGLAATRTLRKLGVEARLKWPNDVVATARSGGDGWHKVSGILAQRRDGYLQVGIGINCLQESLGELCRGHLPFGSIRSLGYGDISPDEVMEQLIPEIVAVLCDSPCYRCALSEDCAEHREATGAQAQCAESIDCWEELNRYLAFRGARVRFVQGEALELGKQLAQGKAALASRDELASRGAEGKVGDERASRVEQAAADTCDERAELLARLGSRCVEGRLLGIDEYGGLVIEEDRDGEAPQKHSFYAGELIFL